MKRAICVFVAAVMAACCLFGCGSDGKTIVVGASSTPHAEILEVVKPLLAEQGYDLQIKVYNDYVLPNTAAEDGEIDANYFQHLPYLEQFNESNNTHLVSAAKIHYEPYGIYAGTVKSLADIRQGDRVAVPNDATNEARALQLLATQGLIRLKDGVGLTATKRDIESNPHNLDIVEMEAALIPGVLDEYAMAVINGNYAISSGLKVQDALAVEDKDSEAAQTFANIVAVKEENLQSEAVQALVKALCSDTVKEYIGKTYDGAVVAIF